MDPTNVNGHLELSYGKNAYQNEGEKSIFTKYES
jgi:hypothetical protein